MLGRAALLARCWASGGLMIGHKDTTRTVLDAFTAIQKSGRAKKLGRDLYQVANTSLWALATAAGLWFLCNIPEIRKNQARIEALRILETVDESRRFCAKWSAKPGAAEHTECVQDLQEIREKERNRILSDLQVL